MDSHAVRGSHRLDVVNGRHQDRAGLRFARFTEGPFGAAKAVAVLILAVAIGLIGTGGTYAYLNASTTVAPGSTISAGTAALVVGSQSLNWSNLAPGQSVTGTFSITNNGDVPLALSATSAVTITPASPSTSLRADTFVVTVANGACPSSGVPTTALSGTLAKGATTNACLVVTLSVNAVSAAQSASAAITATISGVQQ